MNFDLSKLKKYYNEHPLCTILLLGLFIRLIAAFFSKGFAMHDDHFLAIEPAYFWLRGQDYFINDLHENPLVSLFYPGVHFILIWVIETIGITDPQAKMFFIRLFHALLHLIDIYAVFSITKKISNVNYAKKAAILMALFWMFPFLSVRSLYEFTATTFILLAMHLLVSKFEKIHWTRSFLIGVLFGISFLLRIQSAFFIFGLGLYLIYQRRFLMMLPMFFGGVFTVLAIELPIGYLVLEYPFQTLEAYINYNQNNYQYYPQGPWYNYILLFVGVFIVPVGFFLFFGFLRTWKKYAIVFLPTFIFFLFHSAFPGKQERFIIPAIPFILLLGVIGWEKFRENSKFWQSKVKLHRGLWIWFWTLNTVLMFAMAFSYVKKSRVESAYFLSKQTDLQNYIVESEEDAVPMPPRFYTNSDKYYTLFGKAKSVEQLRSEISKFPVNQRPNYLIMLGETRMDERLKRIKEVFPKMALKKRIEPGLLDYTIHKMNPINLNQVAFVYKISGFQVKK